MNLKTCCTALWILLVLPGLVAAPILGADAKEKKEKSEDKPVVAVFSLDRPIHEAPKGDESLLFGSLGAESLKDLVARLKKARDDKNVKAVVLLSEDPSEMAQGAWFNMGQIEELHQAIDQVRASGKEVLAHVDSCSTRSYGLVSGASSISMVPTGLALITGFYVESPYLRGLLDKIGVKPDFLTCGDYKSAAEIFMRKGPSPEAERMRNWLLDSTYDSYVQMVAKGRRVEPEKVREWIDGAVYTAEKARRAGIIDKVQHRQQFEAELKSKFGENVKFDKSYGKKRAVSDLDLSSPLGVFKLWADLLQGKKKKPEGKDAVAIVYVDGPIMQGKPEPSLFPSESVAYSTPIRKALDKAADDKSIKAVVLRVDSPGGSAVASEIILNATKRVKDKKPLVVSMGNIAGSGGYYVACGSDTIFADPMTITGSIGVVGGKIATTDMWGKIGISFSSSKRGANADILSSERVFTQEERAKFQDFMNEVYGVFKGHVVAIRGDRLKKKIDEIAGGRVYTGKQALELGLVDKLGGLEDAIQHVAKQANLKDYEVRVVPEPENFLEALFKELGDGDRDEGRLDTSLGVHAPKSTLQSTSLLEAAMPYLKGLDGARLSAVKSAFLRLDLLHQERAVLMMPEMTLGN